MQFGIAIPTAADSWRLVRRAEELGFGHAWFFDTQMLSADPFVAMTAAAMKTSRIKLGTGVLIPSNRIAPVAATAFASLNKLAPGRIVFGVSTGFTGRRTMGLGAVKLADMEEYIQVVHALWRGETVELAIEGKQRKIRLLNPELGLINTDDPIPTYIAASGPKARALTAKLGAAWIDGVADPERGAASLAQMRTTWQAAGQTTNLTAVAWISGAVLEDGEPVDGPRGMALAGPRAATLLHRAADTALAAHPTPLAMQPAFAESVEGYIEHARSFEPKDAYYLANHRGHLMFVRPDERPFITAEMIRRTTFVGAAADLTQRIGALKEAGFDQVVFSIPPGQEHAIEDWGRIRRTFG
ncbi:LLM class flavin-dependent oxidoreductase [Acidisphaera sp. S103]|uniref:LLM class flavin-dependent oxidoreductase n=1 Tax=Acidisphaera sp. S103 TaxID=1747223 RepID=UPI00131CD852|nr:LLM class flavin-dependent oxidoreductase [Acidisphaera sp. S103]